MFHSGSEVHRISYCLELHTEVIAESAHHNWTGVNADTHLDEGEIAFLPFDLLVVSGYLPVNGHGRSQGSLWRILKCYGGAEEGHYPVPCHLVHRAFIGVHPVNEDLIYLIHHGIHGFGAKFL